MTNSFPPASIGMNSVQNQMIGTPLPHDRVNSVNSRRTPLSSLNLNGGQNSGLTGYGMRAGLKVGHPQTSVISNFSRPSVRSGMVISLIFYNTH